MSDFTLKLVVGIVGINPINGEKNILSLDENNLVCPISQITGETVIESILLEIFNKYIDLDPGWITYKIKDVIKTDNSLILLYGGIIPLDTTLKNAYWLPSWKCMSDPNIATHILKD